MHQVRARPCQQVTMLSRNDLGISNYVVIADLLARADNKDMSKGIVRAIPIVIDLSCSIGHHEVPRRSGVRIERQTVARVPFGQDPSSLRYRPPGLGRLEGRFDVCECSLGVRTTLRVSSTVMGPGAGAVHGSDGDEPDRRKLRQRKNSPAD
jgi:hypothetical protein